MSWVRNTDRKSTFFFGPGEKILDQIETICSQQDKFGNDTKTFWFRFQNDIGTFVLSFLTLLIPGRHQAALLCDAEGAHEGQRAHGQLQYEPVHGEDVPRHLHPAQVGQALLKMDWLIG
jgi:hypothetical protein